MNIKKYRQIRVVVALFVSATVSIAVIQNSYLLAAAGVLTGMLFLVLASTKTKVVIDEREETVRQKAAQLTYAVYAPVMGIGAFFLTMFGRNNPTLMITGRILSYLTLLLIALFAIFYYVVNRRFGGGPYEK